MTPEQRMRLLERQSELVELFIEETDCQAWKDLSSAQKRGDTYWLKKNAAQTIGLVVRIESVFHTGAVQEDGAATANIEKLIADAGKKVARIGNKKG